MLLARKIGSAVTLVRSKGWTEAADLTRIRAEGLWRALRPVPSDPVRRARRLAAALNGRSVLSAVPVGPADLAGAHDALIIPYVREHFAEAAAAGARIAAPTPLEVVVLADALLQSWGFRDIAEAQAGWARAVVGTPYARRIDQVARRAALRLGRLSEAARDLDGAGDDLGALVLRGDVFDAIGRMDEARDAYEAAIRRDGTDPHARQGYGFHLMKAGRVRDGLASWSIADTLFGNYPLRPRRQHWRGEPLWGRHLMVIFEHGLGDMLQVARFLPRLLAREPDATVTARVPAPLASLMARAFPAIRFVTEDEREPDYDVYVPAMHLAAVLDAPDLSPRGRYIDLGEPAARPAGHGLRVGVCWRGHPRQYEITRSIPLDTFATLFSARAVEFVVLLNRVTAEEEARLRAEPNVSMPPIGDFLDLAALVASCDLVVTVDTAVVHLAGAGGAPTLLLSRPDACWRWGASGSPGPWYDGVEVLRHDVDLDWSPLLAAAAGRIAAASPRPAAT